MCVWSRRPRVDTTTALPPSRVAGLSVQMLGAAKVLLGVLFGQSCLALLSPCAFPYAVLGAAPGELNPDRLGNCTIARFYTPR